VIFPDKPVRSLSFHMLLRNHGGKAWFRDPELRVIHTPEGACLFDGVPVRLVETRAEGFQVRDVAAGSGFSQIDRRALGLELQWSETNWHRGGRWQPMSDADLLYRRALCKGKPYCFLMNTQFEQFSHELVERYMKRALAYGMFPGFFSHNASQGHYFTRPDLYNRDRLLFKKYVPLCRRLAEAGWEPMTLAESSDPHVHIERFGDRYLTVFNDSAEPRATAIQLHGLAPTTSRELLSSREVTWKRGATDWTIEPEDVAVIDLGP
jgi:hypothetical protein